MSKLFKPNRDAQMDVKESVLGEQKPIIEKLPAVAFPQLQAIAELEEDDDEQDVDVMCVGKKCLLVPH